MDSFWQNIAIIPLLVGAVVYMARHLAPRRSNEPTCDSCQPVEGCHTCPLVNGTNEKQEKQTELVEL